MRFGVEVAGPPQMVFEAVADFGRLDLWDPMVDRSELVAGKDLAPGARYRLTTPRGMTLVYEVVESVPPRRIVYRGGTKRVISTDTITVEPAESGSHLTIETVLDFSGWTRVVAPFILAGIWVGGRTRSLPGVVRYLNEVAIRG